jgi:hypothetical protein
MTDNLRIWSQVEKTDPAHTKKVNLGHSFTAISAAYQIKRATETFGPIGEGWGYDAGEPIFHDLMVFVPVTLWHGDRTHKFGPMFGGAEWKNQKGRIDSDALKKATTDALTKLLSQLGFNADVFLGLFDDNKYVAELKAEFAEPKDTGPSAADFAIKGLKAATSAEDFKATWEDNRANWKAVMSDVDYARVVTIMQSEAKMWAAKRELEGAA